MELTALLERIQNSRRDLNRLYQSLPVAALEGPDLPNGWSVKDMLAHIAAWESYLLDRLSGREKGPITDAEADVRNEAIYRQRQDWTWQEVESEAKTAHARLLDGLKTLSADRLTDPLIERLIAGNTFDHYDEHRPDLERLLRQWHSRRKH